jgi:EAL domain-containing protein (putative c-di-GMP-specific phosphodiesterase class I)
MYQAKAGGRNMLAVFDPRSELAEAMAERLSWNRRISEALKTGGFELHLQGVFELATPRLHHLEVLVRMKNPTAAGALISPGRFLGAAEQTGQIVQIDRWVLARSIEILGNDETLPPLAVNVSGRSINDHVLPQYIRARLEEFGVEPERLIVELAETALAADIPAASRFIEAVRGIGCQVSLDDFGSGLGSFGHLQELDANIIKIDGRFVRDLSNNLPNRILVKAIVEVAHGLGKTLVAEFVEDAATLEMVRSLGVPLAQGYHLDRPAARRAD